MTKPAAYSAGRSLKVRLLVADDVASYRELRLEGLKSHPEAFASSWEYEAQTGVMVDRTPRNEHGLWRLGGQVAPRWRRGLASAGSGQAAA